jgi:hypothetical protein
MKIHQPVSQTPSCPAFVLLFTAGQRAGIIRRLARFDPSRESGTISALTEKTLETGLAGKGISGA